MGSGLRVKKKRESEDVTVGRASSPTGKLAVTQRSTAAGLKPKKLPPMERNEIGSAQAMRPPKKP